MSNYDYNRGRKETPWEMIVGGIGAAAGYLGGNFYASNKLRTFDAKVADLSRTDIMSRGASGTAGIGAGLGEDIIQNKHTLELINSGEHKFAKFIYNIGGRGSFALGAALAIGGAAALTYYAVKPKNTANYNFDLAQREAINRAKDYSNPILNSIMPEKPASIERIETIAKYDTRKADILDIARQLDENKDDPVKQRAVLDSWQKKHAERNQQANNEVIR